MRVLVAIANHGTKNRPYLDVLLEEYRSMDHDVDVVVLSDREKELGPDVEVRVGAPTADPWSLPFAHRPLFAERADDYDLFIYSEDDTRITQRHLDAFVAANDRLPDDQIPGFQRFEVYPSGERSYCSIHSTYRWIPSSASVIDGEVFADHSNQHAACYVLTRDQLRVAIRSGGFLVEPHAEPFDMLVSAATDPYTQCGLERRLPVTRIDDFLVHHLPNVYLGKLGVDATTFRSQCRAVSAIGEGTLSSDQLFEPATRLPTHLWDVPQYPRASPELLALMPSEQGRCLSVGSTSGQVETEAFATADEVVVVPLDEVTGSLARERGFATIAPRLEAIDGLPDTAPFDTILVHGNLHHFEDPADLLRRLGRVAAPDTTLVVSLPNVAHHRLRRLLRRPHAVPLPSHGFAADGIHAPGLAFLGRVAEDADIAWNRFVFERPQGLRRSGGLSIIAANRWTAPNIHAAGHFTAAAG